MEAIGEEQVNGIAKPIDILLLQEQDEPFTSTQAIVNLLNGIYGPVTYARGSLATGPVSSSLRQTVKYNQSTIGLLNETYGLLNEKYIERKTQVVDRRSVSPPREALRATFRPIGYGSDTDFLIYCSRFRAGEDASDFDERTAEAINLTNDAESLPDDSHFILAGYFNLRASNDAAFQALLTGSPTGGGGGLGGGRGGSRSGGNQANGSQALTFDPTGVTGGWRGNSTLDLRRVDTHSTGSVNRWLDFQLPSLAFGDGEVLDYFDGSYRTFGNNGSTPNDPIYEGSSAPLLGVTSFSRQTVFNALRESSDHLPVIVDYQVPAVLEALVTGLDSEVALGEDAFLSLSVENAADVVATNGADELDYVVTLAGDAEFSLNGMDLADGVADELLIPLDTSVIGTRAFQVTIMSASQSVANELATFSLAYDVVATEPLLGDLNLDGTVTGAGYVFYRDGLGNQQDSNNFLQNFGDSHALEVTASRVPEPSTVALLAMALAAASLLRQRRCAVVPSAVSSLGLRFLVLPLLLLWIHSVDAASLVQLEEANWDEFAPAGKEVDCIYGDYVLRNDKLVAVIAEPVASRNANLTVRGIGGSLIDFTTRHKSSDQLSCFYPQGGGWEFKLEAPFVAKTADSVSLTVVGSREDNPLQARVTYTLTDGVDSLLVVSDITNPTDEEVDISPRDGVRADGEFETGIEDDLNLWWAYDEHWGQAYGIATKTQEINLRLGRIRRRRPIPIRYWLRDEHRKLKAGETYTVSRLLHAAKDSAQVLAWARKLRGRDLKELVLTVKGKEGPIQGARVELLDADQRSFGVGKTANDGRFTVEVPPGNYKAHLTSLGREDQALDVNVDEDLQRAVLMSQPGYVRAEIADDRGGVIPCKVAFTGTGGTPNPSFGPDSAVRGVRNLQYTPDGRFNVPLAPGKYRVLVSHGPEYDAVTTELSVSAGATTDLKAVLKRSIDTAGWISADFHSHSSPSGDNTSSQAGRVLNLLAEHIEFAPCTEHNRISTYVPHLERFNAIQRMATCSGMELTGRPLPLNHQNAFPLVRTPRTQDGGGPTTDVNPVVQIERLAMWDDSSEKLIQVNHPNIIQMYGDRDLDRIGDEGFRDMFGHMDVIEVHPPEEIFNKPEDLYSRDRESRNVIFPWMQLLNQGFRVPGVVNTDAHWNYHGSGWLRNYIRVASDDPSNVALDDLVESSKGGHIVMTNGPFLEVEASSVGAHIAGPGEDLQAAEGKVNLSVRVQCANWLDINRVQVFINGRAEEELNFRRSSHPEHFGQRPVVFEAEIPVSLEIDAHLIVAAAGVGLTLGAIYGEEQGERMPIAVTNPIFVNVDGEGFQPNLDPLGLPLPKPQSKSLTNSSFSSHPHKH